MGRRQKGEVRGVGGEREGSWDAEGEAEKAEGEVVRRQKGKGVGGRRVRWE